MEFLLGESTVVVDILDDETSKQSEGVKEGKQNYPVNPKKSQWNLLLLVPTRV